MIHYVRMTPNAVTIQAHREVWENVLSHIPPHTRGVEKRVADALVEALGSGDESVLRIDFLPEEAALIQEGKW
jgi:hypothetical protein